MDLNGVLEGTKIVKNILNIIQIIKNNFILKAS